MTRRGIFATLALGLICAIASAPVPPALAFSPAAPPPPIVHSADALRDLWAVRYETDSPELMRNDLIRRYGPLPWHFERGDRQGSEVAGIVVHRLEHELVPTGELGNPFFGLTAYGSIRDLAPDHRLYGPAVSLRLIETAAFDRRFRHGKATEVGAVITLPA